jgi:hypothetical protein
MKRYFLLASLLIALTACNTALERDFVTPPADMRTGVYWYWCSGDVTKEGVINDLKAMKSVGIDRAFIGLIDNGTPLLTRKEPVKLFSDEWWEIIHAALKTATELDVEIGMFNCPGWSQAGGPWIKPEMAMRYLASSETRVKGGSKLNIQLPVPQGNLLWTWDGDILKEPPFYQDVKVLAFPVPADYRSNLFDLSGAKISLISGEPSEPVDKNRGARNLPEGVPTTVPFFPKHFLAAKAVSELTLELPTAQPARSLTVYPGGHIDVSAELQAKVDNEFKTIKTFSMRRSLFAINVGFDPYGPTVVSFPEVKASAFRIVFRNGNNFPAAVGEVVLSNTPSVELYVEKSLGKLAQWHSPSWFDYKWPAPVILEGEFIDEKKVLDVSKHMAADGTFAWDAPEGEWIIMRTGMVPTRAKNSPATPEATGLEIDKISDKHLQYHFDSFLGKIMERIPAEDRKSFKIVIADSYETGSVNFTDDFIEQFKEAYDYDPVPFIPAYYGHVIADIDKSERFLWDVRRLVADRIAYGYMKGLTEVCAKHGLQTWGEDYGDWGFPGEFLNYGGQTALVAGEFWDGDYSRVDIRSGASAAHTYNKKEVAAESFTGGSSYYARYPAALKRFGDWAFSEGVNQNILHVYVQQADETHFPGRDEWYGQAFNRKNTWFSQIDMFVTYLKRCGYMLQQGLNVADIAFFIGEDTPRNGGFRFLDVPKGYQYDFINSEVIVRDATVKNGLITLPHGTAYRVLVLPPLETMRPAMIEKLSELVEAGAVIVGHPPKTSPSLQNYPEADKRVKELSDKMWGDAAGVKRRDYGKGIIFQDVTLPEVFAALKVIPDCGLGEKDNVLYSHRTLPDGADVYFVFNQTDDAYSFSPVFREGKGRQPELWDPVQGVMRKLPAYENQGDATLVPLRLEKHESVFIVFREKGNPQSKDLAANFPGMQTVTELNSAWEASFNSDAIHRGPSEPVVFTELSDWKTNADPRIKFYSGTAIYKNKFTIPANAASQDLYLDLGSVGMLAKVKVNGQYVGGVWTAPYRINISKQAKAGENQLEIEVVNTWVNRLIGDRQFPEQERITSSRYTRLDKESQMQSSGLMGPVKVVSEIKE